MKLFCGIFSLLIVCSGYAQETKTTTPVISRYIIMTGTIDKYPVTFHLYQTNNNFSGFYYYNSTEVPLEISGDMTNDHVLKLTHFYYGEEDISNEIFDGIFKDTAYSGLWSYRGKKLNFHIEPKKDIGSLIFDYIWSSGTKKIAKQENMREKLSYNAATIWPAADSKHPAVALLQKIIRNDFEEKNSKEEIGKILVKRKNEILNPTKQTIEDGAPYETSDKLQIVYSSQKLLTLSHFNYGDYGGAHGIYGTSYTCIDLMRNKELKLGDVLDTTAAKTTLEALLVKKFRSDYKMKKEDRLAEMLLTDTIPVNDNFLLTSKGIAFNYLPYEIGPYVMGEIQLFIPYKEISRYIKPGFKKLIN
jgi:hypothetical protein